MLFSGVSVTDATIKLWDSIGSRKSLLKGCLLQFSPDRKQIIPIDGATVEKNDPKVLRPPVRDMPRHKLEVIK